MDPKELYDKIMSIDPQIRFYLTTDVNADHTKIIDETLKLV